MATWHPYRHPKFAVDVGKGFWQSAANMIFIRLLAIMCRPRRETQGFSLRLHGTGMATEA
jgi:hypothetical protein